MTSTVAPPERAIGEQDVASDHHALAVAVSAIQSSAASNASFTTTRSTGMIGHPHPHIADHTEPPPCRNATRYTSSFTGKASASTGSGRQPSSPIRLARRSDWAATASPSEQFLEEALRRLCAVSYWSLPR